MWFYIFNIHCHNDKDSLFYTFCEYEGAKGSNSNSIASFMYDFICRKFAEKPGHFQKLVMFCDGAGGQNKNWTITRFFAWLLCTENLD